MSGCLERVGVRLDLERGERFDPVRVFGVRRPLEVEIGSGKGEFLVESARRESDASYLGVEVSRKYAERVAERIDRSAVANARIAWLDSRFLFARAIDPRSVRTVHIYFPDPWPKRRHHKRRHFTPAFARDVARALVPGGSVRFLTDDIDILAAGVRCFERCAAFARQPIDLDAPGRVRTGYERKWRAEGRPIHAERWVRRTR